MHSIELSIVGNQTVTTSRQISEVFSKQHSHVLRKIQTLDCSEEFNRLNFELVDYIDSKGQSRKEFQITRDGFTMLAMGFTGKKAAQFKEAYINAFNDMEKQLSGSRTPPSDPLALPGNFHYTLQKWQGQELISTKVVTLPVLCDFVNEVYPANALVKRHELLNMQEQVRHIAHQAASGISQLLQPLQLQMTNPDPEKAMQEVMDRALGSFPRSHA